MHREHLVTGVSIRLRILKATVRQSLYRPHQSYRGLDPFEDTESVWLSKLGNPSRMLQGSRSV